MKNREQNEVTRNASGLSPPTSDSSRKKDPRLKNGAQRAGPAGGALKPNQARASCAFCGWTKTVTAIGSVLPSLEASRQCLKHRSEAHPTSGHLGRAASWAPGSAIANPVLN